jgi:hypothetical protein
MGWVKRCERRGPYGDGGEANQGLPGMCGPRMGQIARRAVYSLLTYRISKFMISPNLGRFFFDNLNHENLEFKSNSPILLNNYEDLSSWQNDDFRHGLWG